MRPSVGVEHFLDRKRETALQTEVHRGIPHFRGLCRGGGAAI